MQLSAGLQCGAILNSSAIAAKVVDSHGNERYDSAAECDVVVRTGTAKFSL